MSCRDYSQLSLISTFNFCRCQTLADRSLRVVGNCYLKEGWLNGQSEFCVVRVCYSTDSAPPDNQCPIRLRWRSKAREDGRDHVGVSEQRLGALPGGRRGAADLAPARSRRGAAVPALAAHAWPLTRSDKRIGNDSKQCWNWLQARIVCEVPHKDALALYAYKPQQPSLGPRRQWSKESLVNGPQEPPARPRTALARAGGGAPRGPPMVRRNPSPPPACP